MKKDQVMKNYLFCLLLILPLGAVVGCGEKAKPTGTLQGTVSFNGENLTTGTVNLYCNAQGSGTMVRIEPDGTYKTSPVPVGTYTIGIEKISLAPSEEPPEHYDEFPDIPMLYQNMMDSPITVEIAEGENTMEIEVPAQ